MAFTSAINSQNYNNIDDILSQNFNKKKEIKLIDSLIFYCDKDFDKIAILHKFSIHNFSIKKDYDLSIKYAKTELNLYEKLKIKNKKYNDVIFNLALFFQTNQQNSNSIFYYKKYLKLDNNQRKTVALEQIGNIYYDSGDYSKAIVYYKEAIAIGEKSKNYNTLFNNYLSLIELYNIYKPNFHYTDSKNLLEKSQNLLTKYNIKSALQYYRLNNNYAFYYLNDSIKDLNKAKFYYLKNLKKSLKNKDSLIVSAMYINLSELYSRNNKDSVLYFLNNALKYDSSYLDKYNSQVAAFYFKKENFKKSIQFIDKSICKNLGKSKVGFNYVPNYNDLLNSKDKFYLLWVYNLKINSYIKLYQKTNTINYIEKALENIKIIDLMINFLKVNNLETDSKLFWQNEVSPIYSKAVYCAEIINNLELASYYIEKNKAILLISNTMEKRLKSDLPNEIKTKENKFIKNINRLKELLIYKEGTQKDCIQNVLFDTQQSFDLFTDSIKKVYPKLYNTNSSLLSLTKIQKSIDHNEVIISFISSNDTIINNAIYELIITKEHVEIVEINNITDFKINVSLFKKSLIKPLDTKKEMADFKDSAFKIYKSLFPNDTLKNLIKNKKLTILPDGILENIPFEALITKKDSLDYLLNYSDISYAYSISFLIKNNQTIRKPNKTYLGFAPVNFKETDLNSLKFSKFEIEKANAIYSGDIFLNKTATKSNFLNNSNHYNIIHLATHADANTSQSPWIAFKNEKLVLSELYTTKTQADLIVLSACNTSLGKISLGEGVLSLARGFFYSGSNTVVSSLWKVNDKSTSILMSNFYKNIKNRHSKSKALTKAKRTYLRNHSLSDTSPYYWASFILIGDSGVLKQTFPISTYYISFLIILVLIFIGFKKNKKS